MNVYGSDNHLTAEGSRDELLQAGILDPADPVPARPRAATHPEARCAISMLANGTLRVRGRTERIVYGALKHRLSPAAGGLFAPAAVPPVYRPIASRDDLSSTRRDPRGRIVNWVIERHPNDLWEPWRQYGRGLFTEIEALAAKDETEAFHAIVCAINSPQWSVLGGGAEQGFCEALARAALAGLRSRRDRESKP